MEDKIKKKMIEAYYEGGVSISQFLELGGRRPSIEKFLAFSEKYEGVPFRSIWEFGGVEFALDYESYFESIGVTGLMLATCMDGETDTIRLVCRKILESMDSARQLRECGEVHLASRGVVINPTAVKAFILAVLDARERYQYDEVVPELYFLLGQVLFPGEPDTEKARQSSELKAWVSLLAWGHYFKHGKYPSYRKLAKSVGVAPSTVSRLFESQEDFEFRVRRFSVLVKDPSKHPALSAIYPHL